MNRYWVVAAATCVLGAGLVVAVVVRSGDEPVSTTSATAQSDAVSGGPASLDDPVVGTGDALGGAATAVAQATVEPETAPDVSGSAHSEALTGELIQSGFEGGEYFCDKGGFESSEIFDYAEPGPEALEHQSVPREQLGRALRGSAFADRLDEVLRVKTVFWRTFQPWVDTAVPMDAATLAEVLDFDIDRTVELIGPLEERQELLMYVELLDLTRTEKLVAGLAVFDFEPNAGWLLTRIELCESARTGGVPQPTPDTSDAYWIDGEGNVYDYDPDAVDD